jgi:glutaredoxin
VKYYKIICWNECPFCLKAKMEMIEKRLPFEYCSVDHSNEVLEHYKSIYKHNTVPIIVEIDVTGASKLIGGYTDLIEHFKQKKPDGDLCPLNEESGV